MNIVNTAKLIKHRYLDKKTLEHDVHEYLDQYASSELSKQTGKSAARDILVYCHVVEKGLSHRKIKPLFGLDRVSLIAKALQEYLDAGGKDDFIIGMALSTLKKYNSVNRDLGVSEDKLVKIPDVASDVSLDVGVDDISESDYFSASEKSFSDVCKARHSIRLYDYKSEPISIDEIMNCINTAQNCPSACNRQSIRIKITTKEKTIEDICKIQGGSKGFGENSGAIVLVTSDLSLYEPSERRMPMLDCGLFIMNFVYALYEKKIGSCILNGSFTLERENEMRKLVPIPENEVYAAVIAISKMPEGEYVKIAHSVKRKTEDIVTII